MRAAGDNTPTLPEDAAALRKLLLETLARCDTPDRLCRGGAAVKNLAHSASFHA